MPYNEVFYCTEMPFSINNKYEEFKFLVRYCLYCCWFVEFVGHNRNTQYINSALILLTSRCSMFWG